MSLYGGVHFRSGAQAWTVKYLHRQLLHIPSVKVIPTTSHIPISVIKIEVLNLRVIGTLD